MCAAAEHKHKSAVIIYANAREDLGFPEADAEIKPTHTYAIYERRSDQCFGVPQTQG